MSSKVTTPCISEERLKETKCQSKAPEEALDSLISADVGCCHYPFLARREKKYVLTAQRTTLAFCHDAQCQNWARAVAEKFKFVRHMLVQAWIISASFLYWLRCAANALRTQPRFVPSHASISLHPLCRRRQPTAAAESPSGRMELDCIYKRWQSTLKRRQKKGKDS